MYWFVTCTDGITYEYDGEMNVQKSGGYPFAYEFKVGEVRVLHPLDTIVRVYRADQRL